jgi:hypothetical protein
LKKEQHHEIDGVFIFVNGITLSTLNELMNQVKDEQRFAEFKIE